MKILAGKMLLMAVGVICVYGVMKHAMVQPPPTVLNEEVSMSAATSPSIERSEMILMHQQLNSIDHRRYIIHHTHDPGYQLQRVNQQALLAANNTDLQTAVDSYNNAASSIAPVILQQNGLPLHVEQP